MECLIVESRALCQSSDTPNNITYYYKMSRDYKYYKTCSIYAIRASTLVIKVWGYVRPYIYSYQSRTCMVRWSIWSLYVLL